MPSPSPPQQQHHDRFAGDPPPPKPNPKFLSFFLKFVIMIFITSLFFVLLGLASLILIPLFLFSISGRRSSSNTRRHRQGDSSIGFSPRRIKKLPQFKFSSSSSSGISDQTRFGGDCAVCLDGFKQGQWCRRLIGCGHVFHRKCVDGWLVKAASCPICRTRVCSDEEDNDNNVEFWACLIRDGVFS